jgi:hypothetical protein
LTSCVNAQNAAPTRCARNCDLKDPSIPYARPTTRKQYTKASSVPDIDAVWPFYQKIIDELCPGVLDW